MGDQDDDYGALIHWENQLSEAKTASAATAAAVKDNAKKKKMNSSSDASSTRRLTISLVRSWVIVYTERAQNTHKWKHAELMRQVSPKHTSTFSSPLRV